MERKNVLTRFDELMKKNLMDGEKILWKGSPSGIKLMEAPYGSANIIRWIVCLIFIAFVFWYKLVYVPAKSLPISWSFPMVFILITLYCAIRPLIDGDTIQRKCIYCITNQRAIVALIASTSKMKTKNYKDIDDISVDEIGDDRGIIYIGRKQKQSFRRSRLDLLTFPNNTDDEDYKKQPLIFYCVKNPQEIMAYFPALERKD